MEQGRLVGMKQFSWKVIFPVLLLSLGLGLCKKPGSELGSGDKKDSSLSAVVVFSVGESKISHSDGTEEKAQLGATVKTGDTIKTGEKGKVDLQFSSGSSIRVSPATTLDFAKLAMNSGGSLDTQLSLVSGKVFANVNKAKKDDSFSVITPTAIAGVRGTSFIVENDAKSNKAKVKVVDGSVSMAPRIPALDKMSNDEISANADFQKLKNSVIAAEVVLEKGQESSIESSNSKLSNEINTLDIQKAVQEVEKDKLVVKTAGLTKSEEQEINTIVKVDEKTASELVELNQEGSTEQNATKSAEIEKKRKAIEEELASKQEAQKKKFESSLANNPKALDSKKQIVSYYERIEKIVLTNGKSEIGAIINQENNVMIVHTEQGIKRINLDDVEEVVYDYQTKVKF
jgi:hypothetical protein